MKRSDSQFSLQELLLIVLTVAVGLAGLRFGGLFASLLVFAAIVALMGISIVALVGRGEGQSMSIGFLLPVLAYMGMLLVIGGRELDPYEGRLPTSQAMRPLYDTFCKRQWIDFRSGKVIADYDPLANAQNIGGASSMGGGGGFAGAPVTLFESPERDTFMALGHCLCALLFGYAGARFARIVHRRRH